MYLSLNGQAIDEFERTRQPSSCLDVDAVRGERMLSHLLHPLTRYVATLMVQSTGRHMQAAVSNAENSGLTGASDTEEILVEKHEEKEIIREEKDARRP